MKDNDSPQPEFHTDENRSYFLTTLHVHSGFIESKEEKIIEAILDGSVKSPKTTILSFRPKGEISFFRYVMRHLPALSGTHGHSGGIFSDSSNKPLITKQLQLHLHNRSVSHRTPYSLALWQAKTSHALGLQSTLKPRGRPKKKQPAPF